MSKIHPIIAVTGSSGAGTTSIKAATEHIFRREGLNAAIVEGDSFHRHDRAAMQQMVEAARREGRRPVTHFGPEGNLFEELEALFREYGESGRGRHRHYVHTEEEARRYQHPPGTFTDWKPLPPGTDLLFYEGLHGGLIAEPINIARHVDLLIGVVPIINLEWIQKIHRDRAVRGYSAEAATAAILSRMHDYVHYIVPQFSRTDVNFQRVPMVDTSNPFVASEIPSNDESLVVIHIANRRKLQPDFRYLLEVLTGSLMSRPDTLVVPAGKKTFAMELILGPVIGRLLCDTGRGTH
ncbi:MAG TPA: phosphoribulokinase [Gammaproteobacteria bacterium]|nr:phosphoribulokinase [Gammaproteobacteria bacterium]